MKTTSKKINEMKGVFKADCEKFFLIELGTRHPSLLRKIKFCIRHFGLHCVAIYRLGEYASILFRKSKLLGLPVVLLHRLFEFQMHLLHHVYIEADIDGGFYIGHVGTIYVGPTKIGKNFSLTHNVTIGVGHSKGKSGIPTIGNDVWVASGAIIAGAIEIGNGVTVSPGSIITRSIPDRCFVAGNPARVLIRDYDNGFLLGKKYRTSSEPLKKDEKSESILQGQSHLNPKGLESSSDA
jgi:serine O-acetyltransferase